MLDLSRRGRQPANREDVPLRTGETSSTQLFESHAASFSPGTTAVPFYEIIEFRRFAQLALLCSSSVSLWFISAALMKISSFPPNSFYYLQNLPLTYWLGVATTLSLLWSRSLVRERARVFVELVSLVLLSLYLLGLPSISYEDPRILDTYQHTGNALGLFNYEGWYKSPIWYVRQFPGAYTFFAQLTSMASIDPFMLMKFYVVALGPLLMFFIYTIGRSYSPTYAALASALFLGGIWFQLHISPQSFELLPYLGLIYLILKLSTDEPRRRKWMLLALVAVPSFVVSHPETPLVTILGIAGFLTVSIVRSRKMFLELLRPAGLFLLALSIWFVIWWGTAASEAGDFVVNTVLVRALANLSRLTSGVPSIPAHPEAAYRVTITIEQGISLAVWGLGLLLVLFVRRFSARDSFFAGFFLAGISTIPVALFSKTDVLQRSYLFALIPVVLLAISLLQRESALSVRRHSMARVLKVSLLIMVIAFSAVMPVARYGVDPSEYVPASSLQSARIAAGLENKSVLFLRPGEFPWRFFAAVDGDIHGPRLEQANITSRPGGFTKPTSTLDNFNLTLTQEDGTADYIVISDFYENLWDLRFGTLSSAFVAQKDNFEAQVSLGSSFSQPYNLVYNTGTDRIYANANLD